MKRINNLSIAVLASLLFSLIMLSYLNYTNGGRYAVVVNGPLCNWLPITSFLIVICAIACYIIVSKKKIISITVSIMAVVIGGIVTTASLPVGISMSFLINTISIGRFVVFKDGLFFATLIIFVAWLIMIFSDNKKDSVEHKTQKENEYNKDNKNDSVEYKTQKENEHNKEKPIESISDREIELLIQRKLNKSKRLRTLTNVMGVIGMICVIITLFFEILSCSIVWLIAMAIVVKITITDSKKDIERDKRIAEAFDELTSYDKKTRILTVNRRSTLIAHLITIQEAYNVNIKHEPLKLHVGSVTNGGVTSGGAFTTGGYNYIDSARKNGLCTMNYKGMSIRSIQLTKEMYEIASKSSIACYLDSSQQQIIVEHKRDNFLLDYGFEQYKKTGYVGNIVANDGKPTVEKGMRILEWLATSEL